MERLLRMVKVLHELSSRANQIPNTKSYTFEYLVDFGLVERFLGCPILNRVLEGDLITSRSSIEVNRSF